MTSICWGILLLYFRLCGASSNFVLLLFSRTPCCPPPPQLIATRQPSRSFAHYFVFEIFLVGIQSTNLAQPSVCVYQNTRMNRSLRRTRAKKIEKKKSSKLWWRIRLTRLKRRRGGTWCDFIFGFHYKCIVIVLILFVFTLGLLLFSFSIGFNHRRHKHTH